MRLSVPSQKSRSDGDVVEFRGGLTSGGKK